MSNLAVQIKVNLESPQIDIEEIKSEINQKLSEAKNIQIEVQEIAFGLKCLKILIAWPDGLDTDIIQNRIQQIKGVSYCNIEDIRRAFG